MFPPHLSSTLRSSARHRPVASSLSLSLHPSHTSIGRLGTLHGQSRSFWGCRRGIDYTSHIDPMFHRFTRYRTLKTRAKLLNKLRRREQWDVPGAKPFFTSRHIRLASHWNGSSRSRWIRYNENDENGPSENKEVRDENGYELNKREKEWKEQMEKMRKRIEKNPYEAVFGRRFEPFWGHLVPSWMREEMGLQGWPKGKETPNTKSSDVAGKTSDQASTASKVPASEPTVTEHQAKKDAEADVSDGPPNGQLTNYSYTSSTSWDSMTQKARREEWDSISGQTRRFEYDPISNRMVKISSPSATPMDDSKKITNAPATPSNQNAHTSNASAIQVQAPTDGKAVDIPVKTTNDARKAIHVPTDAVDSTTKTSVYFPSLLNTSMTTKASKPSVSPPAAEKDLDSLTADDVRASMGRPKPGRASVDVAHATFHGDQAQGQSKVDLTRNEWDRAETRFMLDRELDALTQKKERLLKQEHSMFHIERQKKDLQKLDQQIFQVNQQMKDLDAVQPPRHPLNSFEELKHRLSSRPKAITGTNATAAPSKNTSLQRTSLQRGLQPALERMQSKQLDELEEPDDSAAHESTGDRIGQQASNVPKGWSTQADTLQADRVQRTSDLVAKAKLRVPRWIDDMNARRAQFEAKKAEPSAVDLERNAKKQKADAMLEHEIQVQKTRMAAHESRAARSHQELADKLAVTKLSSVEASQSSSAQQRYVQKVRDLRKELDIAFKQSSVQAEKHLERIRGLEQDLEKIRATGNTGSTDVSTSERQRYVQKIQSLRKELDVAFKQSSIYAEMQVERIRALEKDLEGARKHRPEPAETAKPVEAERAEGDFCSNITKYAKSSSKWYKQPTFGLPNATEVSRSEANGLTQKESDRALVHQVKDIYEKRYGTIDYDHVQAAGEPVKSVRPSNSSSQVYEAEIDPELGEALETFESDRTYSFKDEEFVNNIALRERAAHEAQRLITPESSTKMRQVIAEGLPVNQASYDPQLSASVDSVSGIESELAPKIPTYESTQAAQAKSAEWGIAWEEPPVYKVLAYDSGNDLFSSATTSSNFTGKESPMSIRQALSQLYQPARFVPHFSELQKDGFQVVDATKDLLVFKKVKLQSRSVPAAANLQDHGVVNPPEPTRTNRTNAHTVPYHGINPIDGTSWPLPERPSTGDFASPTGFVGDRWDALESQVGTKLPSHPEATATMSTSSHAPGPAAAANPATATLRDQDDFPVPHPRVKREERVFTGARLTPRSRESDRRRNKQHRQANAESSAEQTAGGRKSKSRARRSRVRWAVGVGLGAAGVAYGIGAAAERRERKELERWQEILEGKRTRWE